MRFFLPAGSARLQRPGAIHLYKFEDFLYGIARKQPRGSTEIGIVPLEAVAHGDVQVLAARDLKSITTQVLSLDVLAEFPSVESIVASAAIAAGRELPHIEELLLDSSAPIPDALTLNRLPGLQSLYALPAHGKERLDLDGLPAAQMQKLALSRWFTRTLQPLEKMTELRKLRLDLFGEPLDAVSKMERLEYLQVKGPAKGWAMLRACAGLEEAHLLQVQIANLRRWNTWRRLRSFTLGGRGVRSLSGLENWQALESLTLINLSTVDLSPLRELTALRNLTLRMADAEVDLVSIAAIAGLKSFTIDSSARDEAPVHLPTLKPLASANALEELTFRETIIGDGSLIPLASLPRLRKVHLNARIGADVEALRLARPDIEVHHVPPDPNVLALQEVVGGVTIRRPGAGLQQWSIFQSFAPAFGLATNYDAERRIRNAVNKCAPETAKRLEWDTEGGAVGIYAGKEEDIRFVAQIINELLENR